MLNNFPALSQLICKTLFRIILNGLFCVAEAALKNELLCNPAYLTLFTESHQLPLLEVGTLIETKPARLRLRKRRGGTSGEDLASRVAVIIRLLSSFFARTGYGEWSITT